MEKALILQKTDISNIKATRLEKCDAVYLGNDFCANLLPSLQDVNCIRKRFDGKIVLSTPILTGDGLEKILRFIETKTGASQIAEVVVNDWGLLYALRKKAIPVSLGRLLALQLQEVPQELLKDFFSDYRISAVEMDDLKFITHVPEAVKVRYHYPLRFLSMAKFCPHVKKISSNCARPCLQKVIPLFAPSYKKNIYLHANAYFELREAPCWHERISRVISFPSFLGRWEGF